MFQTFNARFFMVFSVMCFSDCLQICGGNKPNRFHRIDTYIQCSNAQVTTNKSGLEACECESFLISWEGACVNGNVIIESFFYISRIAVWKNVVDINIVLQKGLQWYVVLFRALPIIAIRDLFNVFIKKTMLGITFLNLCGDILIQT